MAEPFQVLKPDGSLAKGVKPTMDEEFLLEALRWMMLSRAYDERATAMQRQGKLGVYSPVVGQEASVVGSCLTVDPDRDWLVPQYRELVAYVHHGHPLDRITANYFGKTLAGRIPEGVKMLPQQVALAAQLQHATGLAWGLKLQKLDSIVLTYIGDGGSSEGDFHEALNLAGVVKAPVVFVLQNNMWAISTPRKIQSAAPSFALRAAGYGFTGVEVDGNDVMAVFKVTTDAVDRARRGEGPTLIESHTYRMSFHNTTDNPSRYLDPTEYEAARKRDPIQRVQTYLKGIGMWDEKREAEMRASIEGEIDEAVEKAQSYPGPEPAQLFENVYAELSPRLQKQQAELTGGG